MHKQILICLSLLLCICKVFAIDKPNSINTLSNAQQTLYQMDPRIVGGQEISITQAPWQVSVRLIANEEYFGAGHICGGSVISPRVVVTAAHCLANLGQEPALVYRSASEFTLVMGSIYLYDITQYTLQYYVLQTIPNPYFDLKTLANDVGLFFINGYISNNYPTVKAITLNYGAEASGTSCFVSGWGALSSGSPVSPYLMGVTVPLVSNAVCSTNYGSLTQGMLCAGNMTNGGVDACQGDSGGPLVCYNSNSNGFNIPELVGIVSWGNGCAQPGYPGVYTNVSYYYSWITSMNQSLNYSYYYTGSSMKISLKRITLLWISIGFVLFKRF